MNRRTRAAEVVILIARMIDASGAIPNVSAFTIATTLDKIQRATVKVKRLHEAECNGDHERCDRCGGDDRCVKGCLACEGRGRKSDAAVKEWLLERDRQERRIEKMLRGLGFLPPSDVGGNGRAPTWEIDRDPRGATLALYEDQDDRRRGIARVAFPVEGF